MGVLKEYKCRQCGEKASVIHGYTMTYEMKSMVCNHCKKIVDVAIRIMNPDLLFGYQDYLLCLHIDYNKLKWDTEKEWNEKRLKQFYKISNGNSDDEAHKKRMQEQINEWIKEEKEPGLIVCPLCDASVMLGNKEGHLQGHIDAANKKVKEIEELELKLSKGDFSCFQCNSRLVDWDGIHCPKCSGKMEDDDIKFGIDADGKVILKSITKTIVD